MPWWDGINTYFSWSPGGFLPYKSPKVPIEIESLTIQCNGCDGPTEGLRGDVVEYRSCVEFRCGGICHACRSITYARMRIYEDGHVLWEGRPGWYELRMERPPWAAFKKFLRCLTRRHT